MTREALVRQLDALRGGGNTNIVVANNNDYFEFRLFTLCGEEYVALGGFGEILGIYPNADSSDVIVEDFERSIEGIEATIASCVFVSSGYFN